MSHGTFGDLINDVKMRDRAYACNTQQLDSQRGCYAHDMMQSNIIFDTWEFYKAKYLGIDELELCADCATGLTTENLMKVRRRYCLKVGCTLSAADTHSVRQVVDALNEPAPALLL